MDFFEDNISFEGNILLEIGIGCQLDDIYIGLTCRSLELSLQSHIYNYNSYSKGDYSFVTSFYLFDKFVQKITKLRYWRLSIQTQHMTWRHGNCFVYEHLNV